jgi:hypothetical protein
VSAAHILLNCQFSAASSATGACNALLPSGFQPVNFERRHLTVAVFCTTLSAWHNCGSLGACMLVFVAVCMKGSGRPESAAYGQCFRCNRGSYNDGEKVIAQTGELRNSWACMQCPVITFTYNFNNIQHAFTSSSTTAQTASETDSDCVPVLTQLVS